MPAVKKEREAPAPQTVHLMGRRMPVVTEKGHVRALADGKAAAPGPARACVERAFGEHLEEVREAMEALAGAMEPEELNRVAFKLYEIFRPEVPPGVTGWG